MLHMLGILKCGNKLIAIELTGLAISLSVFLITAVLILFLEKVFVRYIKQHNKYLWEEYTNFEPGWWWRFLDFMKRREKTDDPNIEKVQRLLLLCEKLSYVSLILAMVFFASTIVTSIITAK